MPGSLQSDGITVANPFQRAGVVTFVAPTRKPNAVDVDAHIVATWNWDIDLQPGAEFKISFVAGDEHTAARDSDGFIQGKNKDEKGNEMEAKVKRWAANFEATFLACKEDRGNRWADAFTPGNGHFSGHLPVLTTKDPALKRNYYMGAISLLSVERTNLALHPRSFITQGERDDGTSFYGDMAMTSLIWTLLEPEGVKATLRRWLVQNPRNGAWLDLRQTSGFDAEQYDSMHGYATNAFYIFQSADEYLRVTGDDAFLNEKLENSQTVFERLSFFANDWKTLPVGPKQLIDFGDNTCLLECAPNYVHCVASMHAVSIWMLRRMADWQDYKKHPEKAQRLRAEADAWLPRLMTLYVPGEGVWRAWQATDRNDIVRHCNDYAFVGYSLSGDLSAEQKRDMNGFVKHELFCRDWMRAMSLKDESGRETHRADHGQQGSFDAWVPWTISALWKLGDPTAAYEFYRRTAVVTREGPFTQAHEFYGSTWDQFNAPVRISSARGNMRESVGGATFANIVIGTFFGYNPAVGTNAIIRNKSTPRPFEGVLSGVRFHDKTLTLKASKAGIELVSP